VPKSKSRAAVTKKKAVSKKHKLKPTFANVTVSNGKGAPNPLMVAAGELIHFSNDDNQDYLIQLFVEGADPTHPVVDVLLPARGDCRLMADPAARDGSECTYNIKSTVLKKTGTTSGGTHVIIITSGKAASFAAAAAG
jgi:hypothetical protein